MAPSENAINEAIRETITSIWFGTDRDQLSVNIVRAQVERKLRLGDGFLKDGVWKAKSKDLIKTEAQKYTDAEEAGHPIPHPVKPTPAAASPLPEKKEAALVKKGTKRSPNGAKKEPPRKKQRKAATPLSDDESDTLKSGEDTLEESEPSDESEFSDAPKVKQSKKAAAKASPQPKPKPKTQKKKKKTGSDNEIEDKEEQVKPTEICAKETGLDENSELSDVRDGSDMGEVSKIMAEQYGNDSDSAISSLIDEAPKAKRRKSSHTKEKISKPKPASKTRTPADLSPEEAELKTLQSQLVKCGIRKIWAFELKDYGTDVKGKFRHLKGMLKEAGMDGRFSETKAREIKEARELQADLEAVVEGDKVWGMARARRSNGSARKKEEVVESEDEEEEEDEEDDQPPPRIPRAKLDLAFLGDESESD